MTAKIKTLQIIHLAICGGAILFYILIGDIKSLSIPNLDSPSLLYLIVPVVAFILSNILFKYQLKRVDTSIGIEGNFEVYQTASIIRWALLEGAALIILILAPDLLIFGILIILYLAFLRPSEDKIKADLQYLD